MDNSMLEALNSVGNTLNSSISPATIAAIIGVVLGSCLLIYLTWFGIRKLVSSVKNALKGRLSF